MIRILFVCLGNICRSPTAEGVFRHRAIEAGFRDSYVGDLFIDSAGTGAYHIGEKPDRRSRKAAASQGVDLENIRARKLTLQDFSDFDYILAMDQENLSNMKSLCPEHHQKKLHLFMNFARNCPGITEVPDPYYDDQKAFDRVFNIVDRAAIGFLDHIKGELGGRNA